MQLNCREFAFKAHYTLAIGAGLTSTAKTAQAVVHPTANAKFTLGIGSYTLGSLRA
jgi:hypothetical protein